VTVLDVVDADAMTALINATIDQHGRLDYLFNNAGIGVGGWVEELSLDDDWRYSVEVNLMGPIHGIHAAYPRMVEQGFGHIVNTASVAGLVPVPGTGAYALSKYAVVGLSRGLRSEGRHHGVRVSVLCPGVVRTPILNGGKYGRMSDELNERQLQAIMEGRPAMDPGKFARRALAQVAANVGVIVIPRRWRAAWWADRLAPGVIDHVLTAVVKRLYAKIEGLK
jgi:NAD(P)-dependent dehydrogenase (short-subunit alcohol dehydrogenase family)